MRKPLIAGNWKMNYTPSEAAAFAKELIQGDYDDSVEQLVCVPTISLVPVGEVIEGSSIGLGAQDAYFEESGAYTGETSMAMVKDSGASYVITGHSERRDIFGDTDAIVNKKTVAALENGLVPILCCGESLEEREGDQAESKIKGQIEAGFKGIAEEVAAEMVVAYEPIWAIGTGKSSTAEDAAAMCAYIRKVLAELYSQETADKIRILYGGSVNPDNIKEYMGTGEIDGALVGGASLKADSFEALVNYRK